jgi:hypothetical protein
VQCISAQCVLATFQLVSSVLVLPYFTTIMQSEIRFLSLVIIAISLHLVAGAPIPVEPRAIEVVCAPSTWQTVIVFFALNYVALATTVKSCPGETFPTTVTWTIMCLLLPFSGVCRGCFAIARGRIRGESDLRHATRARAMCVLMRTTPTDGTATDGTNAGNQTGTSIAPETTVKAGGHTSTSTIEQEGGKDELKLEKLSRGTVRIHGEVPSLPDDYAFTILPSDAKVFVKDLPEDQVSISHRSDYSNSPRPEMNVKVCHSHNVVKCIASIIQLGYSCVTLYRARSDQVELYGYAAFGLTVVPYAVMSIVNLIANIVTPDYPFIYMVRSDVMKELEKKGYCFDGTVGTIEADWAQTVNERGTWLI